MEVSLVIMLTLLTTAAPQEARQALESRNLIVEGTVIDGRGKPDADAEVMVLAHQDGVDRSGGAFSVGLTDANGHFRAEYNGPSAPRPDRVYLFITSNIGPTIDFIEESGSKHAQWVMGLPFVRDYAKLGRRFQGIPIRVKGRDVIDVGNVRARLRYAEVLIKLLDPTGKPLLPSQLDASRLALFGLRIRDEQGEVMEEGSVAPASILPAKSSIWMALPEGRWQIEVWTSEGGWVSKTEPVQAVAKSRTLVTLVLTRQVK
jgi:hypothetical protein